MILSHQTKEYKIDREAFDRIVPILESGAEALNCTHLAEIFGRPFWELIVVMLVDSKVAHSQMEKL